MIQYIVVSVIAYFIGSISFSVIFSRKFAGFDVREKGSKNAGSTNVLRTVGKKAAILTLLCDVLKGVVAVLIAIIAAKIWEDINGEIILKRFIVHLKYPLISSSILVTPKICQISSSAYTYPEIPA